MSTNANIATVARVAADAPSAMSASEDRLPDGWRWVTVGDMADQVQYGTSAKTSENSSGVPVIRMGNIQEGSLLLDSLKYLPADHSEFPELFLRDGDLLFNRTNSAELVGKSAVYRGNPERASFASYLIRVRLRSIYVPEFLAHYINSPHGRRWVSSVVSQQVGQANVNGTKLKALRVPVPPLPEQLRIVAEIEKQFTRLDASVAALRCTQANLKRYRAAVLKAACEGRLVPTEAELAKLERRRSKIESGEERLARVLTERRQNWRNRGKYKEPVTPDVTNLQPLPAGWTWSTVDQLCSLVTDGDHNPPKRHETGLPHLTAKNVRNWRLDATDCTFISTLDAERVLKRYDPVAGDLIVTCVGTVGRTAIVPAEFKFSPDRNLAAVRLVERGTSTRYLNFVLSSPKHQELIRGASGSTAQPHLYLGDLRAIAVPLPPLAEQTRIVAEVERRLSVVEELETVVNANLQRAARLRQSLLRRAFTAPA